MLPCRVHRLRRPVRPSLLSQQANIQIFSNKPSRIFNIVQCLRTPIFRIFVSPTFQDACALFQKAWGVYPLSLPKSPHRCPNRSIHPTSIPTYCRRLNSAEDQCLENNRCTYSQSHAPSPSSSRPAGLPRRQRIQRCSAQIRSRRRETSSNARAVRWSVRGSNFISSSGSADKVIVELAKFQNPDGGFGNHSRKRQPLEGLISQWNQGRPENFHRRKSSKRRFPCTSRCEVFTANFRRIQRNVASAPQRCERRTARPLVACPRRLRQVRC